jgi:hypothetical protein
MIGKGDAHPFVGCFLSRSNGSPKRACPSGSSPSSFSLSAKGACEKSPSDYDHKAPSSLFPFTAFFLFRESLKPLKLCLHTARKKKRIYKRRKGSRYDALGSYLLVEP